MLVCSRLITEQHHKKDKKADEAQQENPIPVESLCYSKSGKTLAAGFVNGTIKFMDSNDLVDLPQTKQSGLSLHGYKVSSVAITKIAFSLDGSYCAVTDAEHVISILQKQVVKVNLDSGLKRRTSGETVEEDRIKHARQRIEWSFIGRRKTHYKKVIGNLNKVTYIVALLFTTRENVPILYSVSKDRHVVEYDLKNSSATDGIAVKISNLVSTYNGGNILTAGGQDGCVNMWTLNASVLESQIIAGGEKMEPFLNMLDPSGKGVQGDIYREFEDYFYYAQIKTQGEDVSVDRIVGDTVPLSQVPFIIQAMGYYPSNMEIDDMINEIKYSRFSEGETEEVKEVTLNEIIKLYLNHRPETSVSSEDLEIALSHAKRLEPGKGVPLGPVTKVRRNQTIKTEGLVSIMQQF
ncbi:Cilia- and flagella-associated protein 251, partial [Globomyces sp. JEL0801]